MQIIATLGYCTCYFSELCCWNQKSRTLIALMKWLLLCYIVYIIIYTIHIYWFSYFSSEYYQVGKNRLNYLLVWNLVCKCEIVSVKLHNNFQFWWKFLAKWKLIYCYFCPLLWWLKKKTWMQVKRFFLLTRICMMKNIPKCCAPS